MRSQSRNFWLLSFLLTLIVAGPAPASGQGGMAQIEGIVRDEQGGVIPGVTVTLRNVESGVARVAVTDGEGRYRFPSLLPGQYELKAEITGFQTVEVKNLVVRIGQELRNDLTLKVGTVAESITVTGESPLVETGSFEVSGVVTEEQIATLPINSRQYLSLALLMPGTTLDATRNFFPTVNVGGSMTFNSTGNFIDGMINNWVEDGEPRQNLPEDAVEEFKISNAQFDAEFGLATAGIVQVVTKSGTNAYHGTLFEYLRDKALNAKGVFEEEKPEFRRHQFGGSIGGPLIKDRMHFFFAAERTQVREFYTVNTGLPEFYSSLEGTFAQPFHRNLYVGRFDWQLNNANSMFVRYAHEDERFECGGCGGQVASSAGFDQETPRRNIVAGHTWIPDARRINDLRFQVAWNAYLIGPSGAPIWKDQGEFPPERLQRLRQNLNFPSLVWGSSFDELGPEQRWQFKDTFTLSFSKHNLKFGGEYSYNPYAEENTANVLGSYVFDRDQFFDPNDPASVANLTGAVLFFAGLPPIRTEKPTHYYGAFIQDDWKVRDTLTVNLGLRYERLYGAANEDLDVSMFPRPLPFVDVSKRGDKNNFGPRLGLAWDVKGTGRSVVRAGYGVYYGHVRNLGNLDEYRNFVSFDVEIIDPPYPDPYLGRSPEEFIVSGPPTLTILDNGYVQPYSQQYSLGFSHQLTSDLALHVDGIYNFTLRDRKIRDINARDPLTGLRPLPEFARIDYFQSTANVKYRALYVKAEKRYSHHHQFVVAYTLTKSEDSLPLRRSFDPFNLSLDWGPSNGERRHALVASGSLLLPGDINVGAIWTLRSELPWNATAGRDLNRDGFASSTGINGGADFVPGTTRNSGSRNLNLSAVNAWRAVNGLPPVAADQIDSSRINILDVRVSKSFPVGQGRKLEVLFQAFNALNTRNLQSQFGGGRISNALSANFGRIFDARPNAQVELAVKYIW